MLLLRCCLYAGLNAENHNIIGNFFYDSNARNKFELFNRTSTSLMRWWEAEPIWTTATKHRRKVASFLWARFSLFISYGYGYGYGAGIFLELIECCPLQEWHPAARCSNPASARVRQDQRAQYIRIQFGRHRQNVEKWIWSGHGMQLSINLYFCVSILSLSIYLSYLFFSFSF